MSDALGKIIEELVDVFKRNYKKPKLWVTLIVMFIVFVLLIPYIDSNFFYFSRMEKRISILERVMELDQELIESNQVYTNEYNSILMEIEQQNERSINSLMNKMLTGIESFTAIGKAESNKTLKFVTGAFWSLIITMCIPFMNTFKKRSDKVLAFIILLLVSALLGGAASIIPTIISPMVNYIGVPLIQIVILVCCLIKSNNKK